MFVMSLQNCGIQKIWFYIFHINKAIYLQNLLNRVESLTSCAKEWGDINEKQKKFKQLNSTTQEPVNCNIQTL